MNTSKINNKSLEIEKIKYILNRYIIRTEKDFSDKYSYAKEFDDTMAQSTAHRKFKRYGVCKDPTKDRYIYIGKQLREVATEEDKLHNLLNCYCDGIIYKDDKKMELWISVDSETEKIIAAKITDFFCLANSKLDLSCSKPICILIGASCLFIKVLPFEAEKQEENQEEKSIEKQEAEKQKEIDRRKFIYKKMIELIENANKQK